MTKVANWPPLSCFTLYLPSFFPAFAGDGAVTDVVAVETAVPADFLSQAIGLLLSFFNRTTDGGGAEYAATCGDDLAVLQSGARMEHFAFQLRGSIQTFDHIALGVIGRITTGGDHHAHGRTRVPGGFYFVQRLGRAASTSSTRELSRRHMIGWVSGSPKRQLNSMTLGLPALSIISP